MRLGGQGEPGAAGPGNLFVQVAVAEHEIFERNGNDVHVKVRLTVREALLGASVVIPTLDGHVSLKVPSLTKPGDRRVITGHGIEDVNGRGRGHQYVHFDVAYPKRLSARQKELIKTFGEDEDELSDEERTKRG